MKIIHEPLRYAHDEGHTDVCYTSDGENFITCGADGDIRVWSVDDSEDPTHTCIGEWALSVHHKNDKTYVATSSNEIQILTHPDGERDGVLFRSTDPFNQIAMCKNENIAALAGEGMDVHVMDLDTSTVKMAFKDLGGVVLSVALCPNATKVAAATGDGKLRVWDLETNLLLKEMMSFPKVNSFANAKTLCRLDFEPQAGKLLAYPEKNSVKLLNTSTWAEDVLTCREVSSDFSVLQFSPCGTYLAAATVQGDFVIWESPDWKVFKTSQHENSKAVTALMWNPKDNGEIVYTDIEGQVSVMSYCSKIEEAAELAAKSTLEEQGFVENEVDFGDFIDPNEQDEQQAPSINFDDNSNLSDPELKSIKSASSFRPRTPEVPLQAPFMPTSTPEHLDPRYLCWNDVGIVKCYGSNNEDDTNTKTIEVEFHDSTFHNSMMLQNYQDYTMGSIGKEAFVVANSNMLTVIPLAGSNKEWSLKVEEYEEIVLVASSETLVSFATASYIIRVCSIYGTQRGIVSVPGPLVSMSAFQNVLLVAYHAGPIRNGDQCINTKLFKFEGLNVECHDLGASLGPESTLYWLGFSDLGTPGMMDSLGMLSLFPPKCNTWIPFCDTTKHRTCPGDNFFVTTIFESYQAIGGVKCKGTIYPGFVPRPTVTELLVEPPFAERSTDKTQMEMNLFTWSNLNVLDHDRKYKETALKIFALACKNDLDHRALEFMQIIANQDILSFGLKYAFKLNKRRLAEKLMELASKLQESSTEEPEVKTFHSASMELSKPVETNLIKPKIDRHTLSRLTPKNKKLKKEVQQNSHEDDEESTSENHPPTINTQDSLFSEPPLTERHPDDDEPPKNPFAKKTTSAEESQSRAASNPFLKKGNKSQVSQPLSLTDKHAGIEFNVNTKDNKTEVVGEKRKLPDSDAEKPAGKQRRLDQFMFSKQ